MKTLPNFHSAKNYLLFFILAVIVTMTSCSSDLSSVDNQGNKPETTEKIMNRASNTGCIAPANAADVANLLSNTGCFSDTSNHQIATGVIPYTVNSLLWTDGEKKGRFFAIPDNSMIGLFDDTPGVNPNNVKNAAFDFPVGSVIIKTFSNGALRVETRLLMRHANDGWAGYAYEWNDAQSDATLLSTSKSKNLGNLTHYFPSPEECMECHTTSTKVALGPETLQLNYTLHYTNDTKENYLDALYRLGYIENPVTYQSDKIYAVDDTSATLEQRARSYLHSNCAGCHRTGENAGGLADFRYNRAFTNTFNVCNDGDLGAAQPIPANFGIASAKVIAPGDASKSIVVIRMDRTGANQMPPVGRSTIDAKAVTVMKEWINSMSGCN